MLKNGVVLSNEIGSSLVKALNLPPQTHSFTLHVETGQIVTCTARYYPTPEDMEKFRALVTVHNLVVKEGMQTYAD
jgi:hypothetical protein